MSVLQEGRLRIDVPNAVSFCKFDGPTHGLSHCMKAVDFIVELADRYLFIEIKDPDNPASNPSDKTEFSNKLQSGKLDEDLKYKYRDSFLYRWASQQIEKPIHYYVLVSLSALGAPELLARTEQLKRKLPLNGPSSGVWKRTMVAQCAVFNIDAWNRLLAYPITVI
ncbi:MAG: hypothetical protein BWY06_01560 [Candidatus Latescibacteria bacterium ADurb.Bin168]|nr:MAG: hypothetical protein BWY06_01560 [Candidatus Latescibacteria bacterium ADurb.Bin168]